MNDRWREIWRPEREGRRYGEVLFKRAVGDMPQMESSKAAARRLKDHIRMGDHILDVGCGAGHYLASLRDAIGRTFQYTGMDATPIMIDYARRAFEGESDVRFLEGDIFQIPFEDGAFDIVMCNNVLLHLPSIAVPLRELCRVARRRVLVRTLVGRRSFRIQEIHQPEEYDADGTPAVASYFNIYSEAYVERLLKDIAHARTWKVKPDRDFSSEAITAERDLIDDETYDLTSMVGGYQVNDYVLLPWCFVEIELRR